MNACRWWEVVLQQLVQARDHSAEQEMAMRVGVWKRWNGTLFVEDCGEVMSTIHRCCGIISTDISS